MGGQEYRDGFSVVTGIQSIPCITVSLVSNRLDPGLRVGVENRPKRAQPHALGAQLEELMSNGPRTSVMYRKSFDGEEGRLARADECGRLQGDAHDVRV